MNRRERLLASIAGRPVDRPPVNFYEINGFENTADTDPFNIYSHPSWKPLIELARDKTDRIVMCGVPFKNEPSDPWQGLSQTITKYDEHGSRLVTHTLKAGKRMLTAHSRQDPDVNTVWTIEHLLKDVDDIAAWLDLPERPLGGEPDISGVLEIESKLGDSGIVMLGTGDPICGAAPLFELGQYTVMALTEPVLFERILERSMRQILPRVEAIAKALPGRLWRVVGSEYASVPYLPPRLYQAYVLKYDKPIVEAIQEHGGFARIHSHGRLKDILDHIAATGCVGLDPIEPPPQGDVELIYVRRKYGRQMTLFGNLEVSDIETLKTPDFEKKVAKAIREGMAGEGRGFVLMPSACPYGRVLAPLTLKNYEKMVELIERL